MTQMLEDFVERLFESRDRAALQTALAEVSATLGFPFFAYLAEPTESNTPALLVTNFPVGWISPADKGDAPRLAKVLRRARTSAKAFVWEAAAPDGAGSQPRKVPAPAAETCIRRGVLFPLHGAGTGFAATIFAADLERPQFARMLRGRRHLLALISLCFHGHARRLLPMNRDPAGTLSPRERECMHWAAQGKSCWEIAQILNISRRTAAFHLDNARGKLGVRTRIQAVAALSHAR